MIVYANQQTREILTPATGSQQNSKRNSGFELELRLDWIMHYSSDEQIIEVITEIQFATINFLNEIDVKCIMCGVSNSCMLDGKADGCSQWFLPRLA